MRFALSSIALTLRGTAAANPWRGWLRAALTVSVFLVAFALAYRFGMSFSQAAAAPFWFPDSVLLCALLITPRSWWVALLLATLPVRLIGVPPDIPLWFLLCTALNDCAKAVFGALLLQRLLADPIRFRSIRDYACYFVVAVLLLPALSAIAGAAARYGLGNPFWPAWEQWFLGNVLASIIVTPVLFYWVLRPPRLARAATRRWVEAAVLAAGLLISVSLAFRTTASTYGFQEWRFYLPIVFLAWAALRFGMLGATAAVAVLAFFAVSAALGSPGHRSPEAIAADLQRFLWLRAAPLYLVAVLMEERLHAERVLRESEQRFRILAEHAPALIRMCDREGRCEFFNERWLTFTGRTFEQERGEGWMQGVNPEDVNDCLPLNRAMHRLDAPFETEYRLRRRDGAFRDLLERGVPRYTAAGEIAGYILCAIDVTERRRQELASRENARRASLGELTTVVAEQLRQPLTAISGNAEAAISLISDGRSTSAVLVEILNDILLDQTRAERTLSSIRSLSRNPDLCLLEVDLRLIVGDLLQLVAPEAAKRGIEIQWICADDLPSVFADSSAIQQVLLNLVLNGMEAMKDVRDAPRRLTVCARLAGEGAEIAVTDHGHGIAPDQMSRVFERFYTTKTGGLGLGLWVARGLIEGHGGRIWAESSQGETVFRFTLRAALLGRHVASAAASARDLAKSSSCSARSSARHSPTP